VRTNEVNKDGGLSKRRSFHILVPSAAILLASATDREFWQGTKTGSPRITDFRLYAQPQKFETITVTIGYKNGQLLRLRVILAPARALDPWRWPKGSQLWGREIIFPRRVSTYLTGRCGSPKPLVD